VDQHGPLLGRGRHADVFELSPGRVLRRYRTGQDAAPEAAIMEHVRRHGYPAPEVFGVDGPSMELERVDGPGLLELVARRPHRIGSFAGLLADLHHRLHQIPAPTDSALPFGRGGCVLHLDLQPGNVVMTDRGPVVLDWGWAAAGPAEAENAHTWLQLETSEVPGSAPVRLVAALGRRIFIRQFLRHFDLATLRGALPQVAEYRLGVRELTERERRTIPDFVSRTAAKTPSCGAPSSSE
jgi:Ser/Thr protein kinase RdoA (MazF antagonist)